MDELCGWLGEASPSCGRAAVLDIRGGDFLALFDVELAGGEEGDIFDAEHLFGDPEGGDALLEEGVAEVDELLFDGLAGHGGEEDELLAFVLVGMPTTTILRSASASRPRALVRCASTVSCGTISPPILEKRERRPSM